MWFVYSMCSLCFFALTLTMCQMPVAFESVDGQTYFASAAARADLDDVGVALAALNGAKAK